jgi:hypothetical protein
MQQCLVDALYESGSTLACLGPTLGIAAVRTSCHVELCAHHLARWSLLECLGEGDGSGGNTLSRLMPDRIESFLHCVIIALFLLCVLSACTSTTSSRDGEQNFLALPVGATLPSGEECAPRVQGDHEEPRPENTQANHFVPGRVSIPVWQDLTEEANQRFVSRIDGKFTGTTDAILAWGACKWGLDADLLRAVAVQESDWRQSTVSDESDDPKDCVGGNTPPCPTSFGIMQLKHLYTPGSYPLSQQSTAFNVDYYGGRIRSCYEGGISYLGDDYGPGDIWGCVGWHFSGEWKDPGSERYIRQVRRYLDNKPWLEWAEY